MAEDLKQALENAATARKGVMAWAERLGTNWLVACAIAGWLTAAICAVGWALK